MTPLAVNFDKNALATTAVFRVSRIETFADAAECLHCKMPLLLGDKRYDLANYLRKGTNQAVIVPEDIPITFCSAGCAHRYLEDDAEGHEKGDPRVQQL